MAIQRGWRHTILVPCTAEHSECQRFALVDQMRRCYSVTSEDGQDSWASSNEVHQLTIGTRYCPSHTNGACRLWVGAVGKLIPVRSVWLEVLRLDLQREVDVVAREGVSSVQRPALQLRVVEYFE